MSCISKSMHKSAGHKTKHLIYSIASKLPNPYSSEALYVCVCEEGGVHE